MGRGQAGEPGRGQAGEPERDMQVNTGRASSIPRAQTPERPTTPCRPQVKKRAWEGLPMRS